MIIRSAKDADLESIRNLWHDCFEDPLDYIDFYLNRRFDPKFCAVLIDGAELVGMIHLLPCEIYPDQKALYWYAAGIRSDRRNRGLFRTFSESVKEATNSLGYVNLCVPAPGLESFYRSIGMTSSFTVKDEIFEREDHKTKSLLKIGAATANDFTRFEKEIGDVIWNEEFIQYAILENSYCDGKALKLQCNGKECACFAIKKDDSFLIDYHNFSQKEFLLAKDALFQELKTSRLIFRSCGTDKVIGLSDSEKVGSQSKISMTLA